MRIVLVITGLTVGGAERVVVNLADTLAQRGHEVMIVYLKGNATLTPTNSSIKLLGLSLNSLFDLPRVIRLLHLLLKEFEPDVVNSHLFHANILMRMMRIFTKFPKLITSAHNKYEGGRWRMLSYRITDTFADITTNVSDEAVSEFILQRAVKPKRIITLHNGISTSDFLFSPNSVNKIKNEFDLNINVRLLLAAGRLTEQKDFPNLLIALSQLPSDLPPYVLLIAGEGQLKEKLVEMTKQLGLQDKVRFLGVRRDIVDLLAATDIFVLSSAWEGFPMIIGEAMACECTIVATDCGGVSEFLGDTGFLVPSKSPKELARALAVALMLPDDERQRIGEKARQRVQSLYSLDAMVDKWLALT